MCAVFCASFWLLLPAYVSAQLPAAGSAAVDPIVRSLAQGGGGGGGTRGPLVPCGQGGQPCQISQLRQLATNVFNFLMALGSIVAVGAVVVAGFQYISSRGDPGAMSDAKQKLAFAIIGLLLLLLTFAIVNTFIKAIGIKKNPLTGSATPVQRFFV